jgi:hypothetical protein
MNLRKLVLSLMVFVGCALLGAATGCSNCPTGTVDVALSSGHKCVSTALSGDMGSSDGGEDPVVTGCADGSEDLLGAVWGCLCSYAKGQARACCKPGFHIPTDATGLDQALCNQRNAFYMADVLGYSDLPGSCLAPPVSCSPTADRDRLRFGCGGLVAKEIEQDCGTTSCGGFSRDLRCNGPITVFYNCNQSTSIDSEVNMEPRIGVLCVRDSL